MKSYIVIKSKLKLIYSSYITYLVLISQIIFLVLYKMINKLSSFYDYLSILKIDMYFWVFLLPLILSIHKEAIYKVYYNYLSRFNNTKQLILYDLITVMLSTFIVITSIFVLPLLILMIEDYNFIFTIDNSIISNYLFLFFRYILLASFVQYIIYIIFYMISKLQKHNTFLPAIPIVLYFVMTLPSEIFIMKNIYISAFDFTAGRVYKFLDVGFISWDSVFMYNIHLISYILVYIFFIVDLFSKKMEYLEYENTEY